MSWNGEEEGEDQPRFCEDFISLQQQQISKGLIK